MNQTAAIVGCGHISRFHFAALESMGVGVKWAFDLSPSAAEARAKQAGARVASSLDQILDDPKVNVVHVLTGSPTHADLCRKILPTRKALICEKTLSTSADDSLELVRLARRHDTIFYTAYMKRFLPAVEKAKELMPSIGTMISCHARVHQMWGDQWGPPRTDSFFGKGEDGQSRVFRNNGGGILVCGGSHVIDLLLHLLGRPRRLFAEVHVRPGRDYDARATALMQTEDGVIHFESLGSPHVAAGFQQNGWDETIEIIGTEGKLHLFSPQWDATAVLPSLLRHYDNATRKETQFLFPPAQAFTTEIKSLYANIDAGRQGEPSNVTGYEVDEVIATMMRSAATGRAEEIQWRIGR